MCKTSLNIARLINSGRGWGGGMKSDGSHDDETHSVLTTHEPWDTSVINKAWE